MSEGLCWEWPSIVVFWGSPLIRVNKRNTVQRDSPKYYNERLFPTQFFAHRSQNRAKFENDRISRNGHRIKTTQANLMILVLFSSAEDV